MLLGRSPATDEVFGERICAVVTLTPGSSLDLPDLIDHLWTVTMDKLAVDQPTYAAYRTSSYIYVEYTDGEREVYNIKADPDELSNLAGSIDPVLLKQMSSYLDALTKCAGKTCQTAEDATPPKLS